MSLPGSLSQLWENFSQGFSEDDAVIVALWIAIAFLAWTTGFFNRKS